MKKLVVFFAVLVMMDSVSSQAEESDFMDKALAAGKVATEEATSLLSETRDRRANSQYFALLNYSFADLIVPSKYGVTFGLVQDVGRTWEIEYLRGSVSVPVIIKDLGEVSDERVSIIKRSYFSNGSFNLSYGVTYFDFSLHLGDDILSRVSGGSYPSMDLVRVQAFGANLAIGNRWIFRKDITLGIDWFSWAQPLYITDKRSAFLDHATDENDKDDVQKGLNIISYFPRFALIKLQFGMSF